MLVAKKQNQGASISAGEYNIFETPIGHCCCQGKVYLGAGGKLGSIYLEFVYTRVLLIG